MAELKTLARPYAKAAYDVASAGQSDQTLDAWLLLLGVASKVSQEEKIEEQIKNPLNNNQHKVHLVMGAINQVASKSGLEESSVKQLALLVQLMVQNNRISLLPYVCSLFEELVTKHRSQVEVNAYSAYPIDDQTQQSLKSSLESKTGKKVLLNVLTDKTLIGGVKLVMGNIVIDNTVKTKLNKLINQLSA